jgi:hypothetical protein
MSDLNVNSSSVYVPATGGQQSAQSAAQQSYAEWSVEHDGGEAVLDLGEYVITLSEDGASALIERRGAGGELEFFANFYGDPHFDEDGDGKTDWDFYEDMTMMLPSDSGDIKLTIGTKSLEDGSGFTLSSDLTITQEGNPQAIEVSGLARDLDGDNNLEVILHASGGSEIDASVDDGDVIHYSEADAGWLDSSGERIIEGFFENPADNNGDGEPLSLYGGADQQHVELEWSDSDSEEDDEEDEVSVNQHPQSRGATIDNYDSDVSEELLGVPITY